MRFVCLFVHGILLHPNFSSMFARLTLKSWSIHCPPSFPNFNSIHSIQSQLVNICCANTSFQCCPLQHHRCKIGWLVLK
jgi:hypothetical protein